jgi:molybdopterin molybdotransferase
MISVKEAIEIIKTSVEPLPVKLLPLIEAGGLVLATDLFADINHPPFRQSAMDGYALCFGEWNGEPLVIAGEVQAGSDKKIAAGRHEAIRIFTGAAMPDGADTVVIQEKVTIQDRLLLINDERLSKGLNVRPVGSEITQGALALEKGNRLTPAAIGFIAGLGKSKVEVIPKPSVAVIVTGKELQQPGNPLQHGQVFESNSYAIASALHQLKIDRVNIQLVDDDLDVLTDVLQKAIEDNDLLIVTGGVSVGDYDFVTKALQRCEVETLFHKVKQRPGKPLYFGKKGNKIVFGLPGNPSSVLTCFYEYVVVAIQELMNLNGNPLKTEQLQFAQDYQKKEGLTFFLKGKTNGNTVTALDAQESYKMKSFAMADCLIVLEENRTNYKSGELVEVHHLPL